jgi:hypothetical protein
MKKEKLEVIHEGRAFGNAAQRLLAARMDPHVLRPWVEDDGSTWVTRNGVAVRADNATLRKDEWKQYDEAIVRIARERLRGVNDLISAGLVYNITNGLGTTVLEHEDMSDMNEAEMNMDAVTREKHDAVEFDINYLPLPIIHKAFHVNIRVLEASRMRGQPLDTTQAEVCTRKVLEKVETILFQGTSTFSYGGGIIYGYMDHPDRNTYSLAVKWNTADSSGAATGETILADVLAMKQASIDAKFYGPWVLYIPTNYETVLDEDFKANSDKSIRQRLLEIDGLTDIRVIDKLTDDNVLLVQMTSDVVRLVQGMGVTPVEWTTEGGFVTQYKVMTIQVPQIRSDQDGNSGIVHGS